MKISVSRLQLFLPEARPRSAVEGPLPTAAFPLGDPFLGVEGGLESPFYPADDLTLSSGAPSTPAMN